MFAQYSVPGHSHLFNQDLNVFSQDFLFVFVSQHFYHDASRCGFAFILLGFSWDFWTCKLTSFIKLDQIWKVFSPSFFECFFLLLLSISSFWPPIMCILVCYLVSHMLWGNNHLFSFFSLFFRLHNLWQSVFKFTDSFLWWLKSTVEPLWGIFCFSYCSFRLQNFYLVFVCFF